MIKTNILHIKRVKNLIVREGDQKSTFGLALPLRGRGDCSTPDWGNLSRQRIAVAHLMVVSVNITFFTLLNYNYNSLSIVLTERVFIWVLGCLLTH